MERMVDRPDWPDSGHAGQVGGLAGPGSIRLHPHPGRICPRSDGMGWLQGDRHTHIIPGLHDPTSFDDPSGAFGSSTTGFFATWCRVY